ncbi:hypothetical protein BC830DRAFT_315235 [Chytriomyces sp. MP71]|nr:hypothetical protein BC830DRAFT_315235 [Chytriomyces sp. MP71]
MDELGSRKGGGASVVWFSRGIVLFQMWTLAVLIAQVVASALHRPEAKGVVVKRLFVHPVKSCRGIEVTTALLGVNGFEFDRLWMVVDAQDASKFVTQREETKMVLVEQELRLKGVRYADGGELVLRAPGLEPLRIPFRTSFAGLKRAQTIVWDNPVAGFDEGDVAAKWWSTFLGKSVRLLIKDPDTLRPTRDKHTPPVDRFDKGIVPQTAFADGYPLLIASESSLAVVNQRLPAQSKPRKMEHFRPNIVLAASLAHQDASLPAFIEDTWKCIRVGAQETLFVANLCTRCQMPTNDLEGGGFDTQVMNTLMKFRRVDKGKKYEPCFGVNAISKGVGGVVTVGDKVEVLEGGVVHNGKTGVWKV